jgi:hypothetical protein
MNYDKKLRGWTLAEADRAGQILVVTCQWCHLTQRYLPGDLLKFRRDMSLDRLAGKFRCEKCRRGDYMGLKVQLPYGEDFGKLAIRRLDRLKQVPVWKDDVL